MHESQSASSIIIRHDSSNCRLSKTQKSHWILGLGVPQYTAPEMLKSPYTREYATESYQWVGLSRLMRVFRSQEQKHSTCQHHIGLSVRKLCLFFLEFPCEEKRLQYSSYNATTRYCGRHSIGWYWSYRLSPAIMGRSVTATLSITGFAEIR